MKLLFIQALTRLFSLVHPRVAPAVAAPVAFLIWRLSRRLRTVSLKNLTLCFPDLSETERVRLGKQSMQYYVRNIFEAGVAWYWSEQRFARLFDVPVGLELWDQGMAEGKGIIILAPHHGSWEFLGMLASFKGTASFLYKPGDDEGLNALLVQSRERFGLTMLPATRGGLKQLYASLDQGMATGLFPDQEPKAGEGRFAPFFGVPALTGVLASRLARRTGARVLFGACLRRSGGRYQFHFLPADDDVHADDMDVSVAAVNRGVEQIVRLDPAQYLWGYKRFRQRPEGEPRFY